MDGWNRLLTLITLALVVSCLSAFGEGEPEKADKQQSISGKDIPTVPQKEKAADKKTLIDSAHAGLSGVFRVFEKAADDLTKATKEALKGIGETLGKSADTILGKDTEAKKEAANHEAE